MEERELLRRMLELIEGDCKPIEYGGETTDEFVHWCKVCDAVCPVSLRGHAADCVWAACVRDAHALLGTEPRSYQTARLPP